jgi:hypothetical protein
MRVAICLSFIMASFLSADDSPMLTTRWTQLLRASRAAPQARPLPTNGPIKTLTDFSITGPMPAHPFVLGNFAVDGQFGLIGGGVELAEGRNAAIQLVPLADQFELEGRIAMKDLGGWFMLVGWNDESGNGYAIHNCTMKESGSPWFITEMRGRKAVEGTNQELKQFEWKRIQDVRVTVQESKLTFQLGPTKILDGEQLTNYQAGSLIFGVYDTRYGPRPVHLDSLRIRAVEPAAAAP